MTDYPRHLEGDICLRAIATKNCPLSHDYSSKEPDPAERKNIEWAKHVVHISADDRELLSVIIDGTYEAADGDSNDDEIEILQSARDELARIISYVPKEDS